jgi:hypothetical protein
VWTEIRDGVTFELGFKLAERLQERGGDDKAIGIFLASITRQAQEYAICVGQLIEATLVNNKRNRLERMDAIVERLRVLHLYEGAARPMGVFKPGPLVRRID